jgi:hypothetical protein
VNYTRYVEGEREDQTTRRVPYWTLQIVTTLSFGGVPLVLHCDTAASPFLASFPLGGALSYDIRSATRLRDSSQAEQ